MIALDIISEIVPAINKTDKGGDALNWMEVFKISHLPIVDEGEYLGLISDIDILDLNLPEKLVSEHCLSLQRPFVKESQHILECLNLASSLKLSVIPVLDDAERFIGIIRVVDLALALSELLSTDNPGGIIILKMNNYDYSLSEIAQIVESNDAKILSFYIHTLKTIDKLQITLKLNRTDISSVIQTFERYNYQIKAIYGEYKEVEGMLQDRINSFFKYLDI